LFTTPIHRQSEIEERKEKRNKRGFEDRDVHRRIRVRVKRKKQALNSVKTTIPTNEKRPRTLP